MQFVVKEQDAAPKRRAPYGALEHRSPEFAFRSSLLKGQPLRNVSRRSSPLSSRQKEEVGGADRDRTDDPLLAKQVLSQLSYSPIMMVGLGRFELPTSPLSGVRSNQLSYRPQSGSTRKAHSRLG
jgi:hypothetical protein